MSMMYHMLELLRQKMNHKELNIARLIYMLARLEPVKKGDSKEVEEEYKRSKKAYREFEENIYEWCTGNDNDSKENIRQLITAMNWYSYLIRNRSTKSNKKEKEKER